MTTISTGPWNTELLLSLVLDSTPPSLNHAYFNNNNKRGPSRTMKTGAKAWKEEVATKVKNELQHTEYDASLHKKKPIRLDVVLALERLYGSDIDGHVKLLQDAVCDGMGLDDRYVVSLRLDKMRAASGKPQTTVRVWRLYE
jgi:Holliday junction resolvase RusA-like endonuclease